MGARISNACHECTRSKLSTKTTIGKTINWSLEAGGPCLLVHVVCSTDLTVFHFSGIFVSYTCVINLNWNSYFFVYVSFKHPADIVYDLLTWINNNLIMFYDCLKLRHRKHSRNMWIHNVTCTLNAMISIRYFIDDCRNKYFFHWIVSKKVASKVNII